MACCELCGLHFAGCSPDGCFRLQERFALRRWDNLKRKGKSMDRSFNRLRTTVIGLLVLALTMVAPSWAFAQNKKGTINIGWTAWSSTEATTNLVKEILEKKMGYNVKLTMADIGIMYQGLAKGSMDFMLMAWLPKTHADYYKKVCSDVANLGPLFLNARLGWVVPDYIPKSELSSISDLKKPEVAKKLDSKIIGIDPGAGLTRLSKKALKDYGLSNYTLVTSSGAGMTAQLARAEHNKKWIVVTGWSPHWMFGKWKLRYLKDPKHSLGGLERSNILARKGFYQEHPDVVAFLSRMLIPLDDLQNMMLKASETSYKKAADEYIAAHPKLVNYWVTGKIECGK